MAENLTIHNHGHNVLALYDGHPSNNTIPKGANSYDYHYPNMQQGGTPPNLRGAGTYFFHDHEAALTAPHFYKGMAAFYIIHPQAGSAEAALNLPSGAYDIPLMIQDRSFNADNSISYLENDITGFQGNLMVVNGTPHPYLKVARRKYRFRLLNASNTRRLDIGLSSGHHAADQRPTARFCRSPLSPDAIPLAPAERADIVIDFAQYQVGDVVTLTNDDPFTPLLPEILQFRVDHDDTDTSALPATLNSVVRQIHTEASPPVTRTPLAHLRLQQRRAEVAHQRQDLQLRRRSSSATTLSATSRSGHSPTTTTRTRFRIRSTSTWCSSRSSTCARWRRPVVRLPPPGPSS